MGGISRDTLQTREQIWRSALVTKLVPAVRFDNSGPYSQPTIRGVGSSLAGPDLSPNVATYIDGFFEDTKQNGYALVDLKAARTAPSEAWTIAVYGRHITDQTYLSSVLTNAVSSAQLYGQPATHGVE